MHTTHEIPQRKRKNPDIIKLQPAMSRALGMIRQGMEKRRDEQTHRRREQVQREHAPIDRGKLELVLSRLRMVI